MQVLGVNRAKSELISPACFLSIKDQHCAYIKLSIDTWIRVYKISRSSPGLQSRAGHALWIGGEGQNYRWHGMASGSSAANAFVRC